MFDGASFFFSDGLGLRPFGFDGIEVRGIGWQIFQNVPGFGDSVFYILTFVEGSIVHHDDAAGREFRQQGLRRPGVKDISIDTGVEQSHGQQEFFDQGADDIRAAFGMPIPYAVTSLTLWSIAMRTRHIVGETALVDINDDTALLLISLDFFLEDTPCVVVGLGMTQRFFL